MSFHEGGYTFLASTPDGAATLTENVALQNRLGSEIVLEDAAALRARFPWLHVDDVVAGTFGMKGEGWFDPYSLLRAFRRRAIHQGVKYVEDTAVGFEVTDDGEGGTHVTGVTVAGGTGPADIIRAGAVVNAAGTAARDVVSALGVATGATRGDPMFDLPVRRRKRCIFVIDSKEAETVANAP